MIHIQERSIHRVFVISLFIKGLNSILEIIGGMLFLISGSVVAILSFLIRGEMVEDPTDVVANQIRHLIPYFTGHSQLFGAFYLLSHGIIKIIFVVSLLRGKLWAYPGTIIVLFLFIAYQLYRLAHSFSIFLVVLTLFDLLIIGLTWHEYKLVKKHIHNA